ncbi:hypothetical protein ACU4HD_38535 [Cupriavidus basilensis]
MRLAGIVVVAEPGKNPLGFDPFSRCITETVLLALGQVAAGKVVSDACASEAFFQSTVNPISVPSVMPYASNHALGSGMPTLV